MIVVAYIKVNDRLHLCCLKKLTRLRHLAMQTLDSDMPCCHPTSIHSPRFHLCARCGWDFHYVCETGILNEHQSVQGETPGDRVNVRGSTFSVSVEKSVHVLAMHYLGSRL